ncbi:MAG: hypothetical protein M1510_00470 [Nitrospirae bacterium]|nr:hypothetical protein [Nitrospirota bacterium]
MQITLSKVLALVVLIAVVFMLTGLSTSASTAIIEKTEKSCCDGCSKTENQTSDHCSTPDCPVFLCLSMNIVTPFTPSVQTEGVYIPHFIEGVHLKSLVKPIFHPPATV